MLFLPLLDIFSKDLEAFARWDFCDYSVTFFQFILPDINQNYDNIKTLQLDVSDTPKEALCLQKTWSSWPVAALHWWVQYSDLSVCTCVCVWTNCTAGSKLNVGFCFYSFQSIHIQNKIEELNQEQSLKKKSTGKRKIRDTDEENRE